MDGERRQRWWNELGRHVAEGLLIVIAASICPSVRGAEGMIEDAALNDVVFLDPARGWAVGDRGAIWRTEDGGRRWMLQDSPVACRLHAIHFLDGQHGWIVGGRTHPYTHKSTGVVLHTADGGRSWEQLPTSGIAALRRITMSDARRGWAFGAVSPLYPSGAYRTDDGGRGWAPASDADPLVREHGSSNNAQPPGAEAFELQASATLGGHVWAAGEPGTRIFHSADGGATWEAFATDQSLPLRALFFLDENRGWAVGALGTILATRDGGRTWLRQRSGGTRVAVLGVFADPHSTPWELFVRVSGNEGFLAAVEYVGETRDDSPLAEIALAERGYEAVLAAGGAYADTTREPPQRLEELLVRKIRQWRPEAIITHAPAAANDDARSHAVSQAVLHAVSRAQDGAELPEHGEQCGLAPWSVKRVFGVQPEGITGSIALTTASLAPQVGGTLADGAAAARALVHHEFSSSPAKIEFQRLIDRGGDAGASGDFMAGLIVPAGGEARRRPAELSAGSLDLVARTAQKQRNVQRILAQRVEQSADSLLAQVDDLTRGFREQTAGELLFQLAARLRQQGRPEQAAEIYQRLLQRHGKHELAEAASLWLVQYYASSEANWRTAGATEIRQGSASGAAPAKVLDPRDEEPSDEPQPLRAPLQARSASTTAAAESLDRDRQALALGEALSRSNPSLYYEPAVRFALAAAARRQRNIQEGEHFFRRLAASNNGIWQGRADAELWLMKPRSELPDAVHPCRTSKAKPYLDGMLDDALWRDGKRIELASGPALPQASAWLAWDDAYVYLAAQCAKSPGAVYAAGDEVRSYDASLEGSDRIELSLDLDRDYSTWLRLTVDHRGWTRDACLGDVAWNPQWFVASSSDAETWTIEAAIPFREIAPHSPRRRDV
ncbi:MAG: hypothetical protein KY475_03100, partial [Planctomycetes bacterium]|nr:hypothetical protein [Planctomycetota bacterium]